MTFADTRTPALEFNNASFTYGGPPVLTGVTGTLYPGEALALIGPNGSGKTTLLCGILRTVTVRQVVEMGLYGEVGWLGRITGERRKRVDQALDRVDMLGRAGRRFGDLSGGQKQRVLLARSIVARPKLILLDEPFNGLDEPNRLKLLDLIHSVKAEGVAVVVSTHDIVLAQETCEKVLLLANRQIGFGPKEEILVPELIAEAYGGHVPEEYHAFADSAKPKKTSAEAVSNG